VPFLAWLYRIAHNLVANHHRNRGRWKETPLDGLEIQSKTTERPEHTVESSERSGPWCRQSAGNQRSASDC